MVNQGETKTALIVGASRGLGFALAEEYLKRGWNVVATERDSKRSGLQALAEKSKGRLKIEKVDITDQRQIDALKAHLATQKFDLLFVNAGVSLGQGDRCAEVSDEDFIRVMKTNALAPMRVLTALDSLVPASGTICVMSSGLASVAENESGGWEVYRGSKAALNTFLKSFAATHADSRTYLAIAPGWVRTDMGGDEAPLSIEQSIPKVVDTVTAAAGKRGAHFFNYLGETVPW